MSDPSRDGLGRFRFPRHPAAGLGIWRGEEANVPAAQQALYHRARCNRTVVGLAGKLGLPIPCLMAFLAYFDGYRSAWLPANLIQAQRDDFGAHTYERVDAKGVFPYALGMRGFS